MTDPVVRALLTHLETALESRGPALRRDLEGLLAPPTPPARAQMVSPSQASHGSHGSAEADVLARVTLSDILDDGILGARPNDKSFPLRLVFGAMAEHVGSKKNEKAREAAFVFSNALNLYFRADLDEEARVRIGYEASRTFYAFAQAAALERELVPRAAPLLASLLGTELERVKLESVDHVAVFDSQVHERDRGSDPHGSRILARSSFLVRVTASGMVRMKAQVRT